MPFTLSHPAVVLPLGRLGRDRATGEAALPLAALVIGSMIPDLPYYLPVPIPATTTHSLRGLVTVDLAMGVAVYLIWVLLVLRPAIWIAPPSVQRRIPVRWRVGITARLGSVRAVLVMLLCVLIGAFTHLFLDGFTHAGMWATQRWPGLGRVVSGYAIYGWLQLATSIIGLGLIAWALVIWWQKTPATNPATMDHALLRAGVTLALVLISGIAALVTVVVRYAGEARAAAADLLSADTLDLVRAAVITGALRFIAVATTWIILTSLAWHLGAALGLVRDPPESGRRTPKPKAPVAQERADQGTPAATP